MATGGERVWVRRTLVVAAIGLLLLLAPAAASATTLPSTISEDITLSAAGNPYTGGSIAVEAGATLTAQPGVRFEISGLVVRGALKAEGSAEAPVVFRKGSTPGSWRNIIFEPGSGGIFDHAEVRYGGYVNGSSAIEIISASPTITNSTIHDNHGNGIKVTGASSPEIAYNAFANNTGTGVSFSSEASGSEVNIHHNVLQGDGIGVTSHGAAFGRSLGQNIALGGGGVGYQGKDVPPDIATNTVSLSGRLSVSGTIAQSATWENPGIPIEVANNLPLTIASGAILTLKPGVVYEPEKIVVKGTLKAEGSAKAPVVFSRGSNSGSWQNMVFEPGSGGILDHTEVRHAGYINGSSAIEIISASPTITNSVIRNNRGNGIKVTESGSPKIEWNRFSANSSVGLTYTGTAKLSAPHNYWGCASGPRPSGCGDRASNVEWRPAWQPPEPDAHCRGEESQCGEGADPVILATGDLSYSHRDLLLSNKSDVPLEFTRAYNSGSVADTGLGPGWSQTGLASASELASGAVLVLRQDGHQDLFHKTEAGYEAPSGVTSMLAKIEGTFQLTTLERTVYRFDTTGRIASITDDHGLKTTYGYEANGRLATITDPSGQTLTFAYDSSNHITSVKDSTGREVKYTYSTAGDLATVTDALGGVTAYTYDSAHRLKTIKDPRGNVILKNTYDPQGRVVEQRDGLENLWKLEYEEGETIVTEPEGGEISYGFDGQDRVVSEEDQLGHTTTTSYDAAGNVDEIVKPGGAKWTFGYDAAGNLTSVVDPEEGERSYGYDSRNRLTSFTDARGETWAYEWDEDNDLVKVTNPAEGETTFTHDASGLPLTATDPNEHTTTFTYDARGNQLSITDPLGHKTGLEYNSRNYLIAQTAPGLKPETFIRNALGELLSQTTPEGHTTQYVYDANGRPTQITDPAGGVWKIAYNAMERPVTYTDPLEQQIAIAYNGNLKPSEVTNRRGKKTTYSYDLANRLTEINAPESETWSFGYDGRGNRTSTTDPRENQTTYEYDLLDRMTKAIEPLSVTSEYGYNANGDLTSVTDPRENTTTYGYDELGRLTEVAQPLGKTTSFVYDATGNLLSQTTAAGTLTYSYDADDRLEEVSAGEATLRSFGYDSADRLTAATDAQGKKIGIAYNEDGLIASINDGRGQSLTRGYDPVGNLLKQVDGRGTLEYQYDKLGRLTSLVDPWGEASTFAYDAEGGLTEVKRPGGIVTTNVYDEAGRLAETATKAGELPVVLDAFGYGYDEAGNVTGKTDNRLEQETTFAYDALNRLVEFNPPGEGSTSYAYDAAGNRTSAGGMTFSFNALNQLTSSSNGTTYSYDGAGRMIGKIEESEETTYKWNLLDHLASVEGPTGTTTYSYDALGRLSERSSGEVAIAPHYGDLTDLPTYDTDGGAEVETSYVQGARGLLGQRSGETTIYPLADAHGDITALANEGGEVTARHAFNPWGEQLSGPAAEMGYLGSQQRRTDPMSDLLQMGARSYAPELGAFLSEDPVLGQIGLGVTTNRYPYVWGNPLTLYDLDGRFPSLSEAGDAIGSTIDAGWDATAGGRESVGVAGNGNGGIAGDLLEGGVDYGHHVADFWSDRYGDFVKELKETCGDSFGDRAADNFMATNEGVPGILSPTLSSIVINKWGGVAAKYRTTGALEWLASSRKLQQLPRVARAAAVSWIYTSLAWEAGVGIGSLARSGMAELYC
jgi:RHS repeat-associated protein